MANYKIIGGDQKVYGPVSEEDIRRWIAEGRLNGQSQVQPDGGPGWQALSALAEFAEALQAKAGASPPPLAPVAPTDPAIFTAEILARTPEVRIGSCLSRSWNLLRANFGLLLGATCLAWLITSLCQFVPLIGGFLYWAARGVLYGGLYLVFLKTIRGQPTSASDVFLGFKRDFGQLVLAGLLTSLLSGLGFCCCLLPGLYLFIAWTFSVPLVADRNLEFWSAMELSRKVVTRVWFEVFGLVLLAFLPLILLDIAVKVKVSLATFPIIQDLFASGSQPDFGKMMEMGMAIIKAGFLLGVLLKVALLFNLLFAAGALMFAYEDLFGPRPAPRA